MLAPETRRLKLQSVFVGSVIDPVTFFVSKPRKINPSPQLKEVLSLESQLWEMRNELMTLSPKKLATGQLVSVICGEKLVKRGRIWKLNSNPNLIDVLLVDTGEIFKKMDVSSRIRELPRPFVEIPVLAYKLKLQDLEGNDSFFKMVRSLVACADETWVKSTKGDPLLDLVLYFEECSPINMPRARIEYEYLIGSSNCVSIRKVLSNFRSSSVKSVYKEEPRSKTETRPSGDRSAVTSDYFSFDLGQIGRKLPNQSSICDGSEAGNLETDELNFIPDDLSEIEVRRDNYHSVIQTSFVATMIEN